MKYIEYSAYDLDISENELKLNIESAIKYSVNSISVPFAMTKFCKSMTKGSNITISNIIDYPLGVLDTKSRNIAVLNAIDNGAEKIDIVLQNSYLSLKKYDKIKQDMISNAEICSKHNIPISYYLEYRIFTHQSLIKACNMLMEIPIKDVYVSTGHRIDNIDDNIVATILLKQKTNINTIFSGNIWTENHVKTLIKNNINALRLNTIHSIAIYNQFVLKYEHEK